MELRLKEDCVQKSRVPWRVGVDGFHQRVPLVLSDECSGRILTLLQEVEMAEVWPTTVSTTFFFFIPHQPHYHGGTA